MEKDYKAHAGFSLSNQALQRLKKLADDADHSKSAYIEFLINEEWEKALKEAAK